MKKFITVLIALCFLFTGVACGKTDNKKEKIKFVCNVGYYDAFVERAAEFNKIYPDIIVDIQPITAASWGEILQSISTDIAGGQIPDIADIASEGMYAFAESGLLEPLDSYIERDMAELAPTLEAIDKKILDAHIINGQTYSLPTVWNNMCMYYNKNVLTKAGVEFPKNGWTTAEFLESCKKIAQNNNGGNKDVYGYSFYNGYFTTIEPWLRAFDSSILTDDWKQSNIETNQSKDAFRFLYDLVNTHKVSPKMGANDTELFVQNKLGFMGSGMWYVESLKNMGFNANDYDVVPFPSVDGELRAVIGVGGTPIFKASKHKEAAWKFSKFLASKKFQEEFLTNSIWAIPSVKTAADIIATKPYMPKNAEIFYQAASYGEYVPAPASYTSIESAILREFGAYIAKAKSLEDALKAATKDINEALKG